MLYKINKEKLDNIEIKNVLEKRVQGVVGKNLNNLMGLEFVCFEFSVDNKYIDILAFDREVSAPVLIELKKENDKGLFDQGMEYFNLLSNRKNDFLIKLHEVLKIPADPTKISWSSSKVIFIGKNFTERQRRAVDFRGLPIELWDYDWYNGDYFKLEQIGLEKRAGLDIKEIKGNAISKIEKEFKEHTEDEYKNKTSEKAWEVFENFKEELLKWDRVKMNIRGNYISFTYRNCALSYIYFRKNKLLINFGKEEYKLNIPNNLEIRNVRKIHPNWSAHYEVEIKDSNNWYGLIVIAKQIYYKIDEEYQK
ncbi:MAG: hypothetical protein KAS01_00440 [Candidatus Pacebacteria bacterium]|nr:hypothetical protein [Candidatus Paceibacterota bacterium]